MAHQAQRYILVMRHAQRQDEMDDGWASAEAARPGGRPWDPPLSSPTGLAQAEEAAAKLAAWERRTGARIVAVVTSPFLRCLQTAAAACRRLGLQQLRVSWAVSEALYRIADIPPGPLPRAMWPRAMGEGSPPVLQPQPQPVRGVPGGLSAEEFLAGLGAEVAAEVALSSPHPADKSGAVAGARGPRDGAAARRGGGTEERRAGNGEEEESAEELPSGEGAQRGPPHIGRVLKGFRVTILPPPLDPVTLGGAHGGAAASDLMRAPPGPSPDSDAASGSQYASAEGEGVAEDLKEKGEDAEGVALLGGGLAALPKGAPLEQSSHLPSPGLEEGGDSGAGGGHQGGPQRVEHGPRVDALPYRSQQGPGEQCVHGSSVGAAAAAVSPPVYGVPYSPETLEAAHVRYRAALRCLMAAAAAATAAEDPVSSGGAANCAGGRAAPPTGAHAPPTHVASSRPPVTAAELTGDMRQWLGPWCALWQAGTTRRAEEGVGARASSTAGGEGGSCEAPPSTAEAGEASSSGVGPGAQSPGPATGAAAASPTAGQLTGDGGGSARTECGTECCSEGGGGEDYDEVRQLRRQPISQLDTPPPYDSTPELGGRRRQQSGEPRGEAVLVVTHGEAVACAAATAAPWALVYEVRHTGFVVLAAGEGEADEEEAKQYGGGGGGALGGEGGASPAAVWELLPDPNGERGVLWMPALDD